MRDTHLQARIVVPLRHVSARIKAAIGKKVLAYIMPGAYVWLGQHSRCIDIFRIMSKRYWYMPVPWYDNPFTWMYPNLRLGLEKFIPNMVGRSLFLNVLFYLPYLNYLIDWFHMFYLQIGWLLTLHAETYELCCIIGHILALKYVYCSNYLTYANLQPKNIITWACLQIRVPKNFHLEVHRALYTIPS